MPIRPGAYGHIKGPGSAPSTAMRFGDMLKPKPVLPALVDLHKPAWISPCYDQLQTSSCVLNMFAALAEYGQKRSGGPTWTPSRLFPYWCARDIEGTADRDSGIYCHDAFHVARFNGIIPESEYPFTDNQSIVLAKPPQKCFDDAKAIQPKDYAPIDNSVLDNMKLCLAHGFPFGGGFQVPAIFEKQAFSDFPILSLASITSIVGGHGVACFGYDDAKATPDGTGAFHFRNSWGTDWGQQDGYYKGMFWMSYEFATSKYFSDLLMLRFPGQQTSLS